MAESREVWLDLASGINSGGPLQGVEVEGQLSKEGRAFANHCRLAVERGPPRTGGRGGLVLWIADEMEPRSIELQSFFSSPILKTRKKKTFR